MINEIFFGKFKDGRPYARLCVATTHTNNHTRKGKTTSSVKHTVWIYDTDLMDKYRDVLTTGSHVLVEGTMCFNEYTDKHDVLWQSIHTRAAIIKDPDH